MEMQLRRSLMKNKKLDVKQYLQNPTADKKKRNRSLYHQVPIRNDLRENRGKQGNTKETLEICEACPTR